MNNLKYYRTKIIPSKTRGGNELLSSSALDSPSVLGRLAAPPPAIQSDMSQVIDDTTSVMNDTCDDASTLLDETVPLGEFLDEQLAKAKEHENDETDENMIHLLCLALLLDLKCLKYLRVMLWMGRLPENFLLVMREMILRNC